MKNSNFNVLLYSDGSHQSFSAAVYTAKLLKNMPNMHLTVVQLRESEDGSKEQDYTWIDTWPVSPTSEWIKHVITASDKETKNQYHLILEKTNEIFLRRGLNVNYQALYSNIIISDISNTADVLLEYARKNSFQLIIMGTRGLSSLKGLMVGSLAHNVLNRSTIPVMLIKKLPQNFIDSFLSDIDS